MMNTYARGHHPASRRQPGTLCRRDRRNRTGCVGISLVATFVRRAGGPVARHYWQASFGRAGKRAFCIETLGRTEAFRRAVAARAAYERSLSNPKSAICHLPT